jgi:hypothetical protein
LPGSGANAVSTNAPRATHSAVRHIPSGPPSLPPMPPSPVDYFKQLLSMKPEEREAALAGRSPSQRKILEAKLREYTEMPPDVRDLRLRYTQLRWHLIDLMPLRPEERASRLEIVAPVDRPLVEERLRQWDALPEDVRHTFLENQSVVAAYLEQGGAARTNTASGTISERQKKLEAELTRLEAMPSAQREQMCDLFRQFFQYSEKGKSNMLEKLPVSQRIATEKAVDTYANLPPEQRQKRIESLRKFINMTPAERQRFLDNAVRWGAMTSEERETWRKSVASLPPMPPMPPGFPTRLLHPPSLPPEPPERLQTEPATNTAQAR